MQPVLTLSSSPEPEAHAVIGDGLNAYNDAIVGYADRMPLKVPRRSAIDTPDATGPC